MKNDYSNRLIKKPDWLKVPPPKSESYFEIKEMLKSLNLATVCQEAHCPNLEECWGGGTATFMLMGEVCTRACKFCAVKTGNPKGVLDLEEPSKVSFALSKMHLDYVVLTSVDRDDLPDEGADHFAKTVEEIKKLNPKMIVEILTPDFSARPDCIQRVLDSKPDVFAHNLETVRALTHKVRDRRSSYEQSLKMLETVKRLSPHQYTKTSLMLGMGETKEQMLETLADLRKIHCDVVTFGQYLSPSPKHFPVMEYVHPDVFKEYHQIAMEMGFLYCASGPLVRSSYKAGEFFMKGLLEKRKTEKKRIYPILRPSK